MTEWKHTPPTSPPDLRAAWRVHCGRWAVLYIEGIPVHAVILDFNPERTGGR